MKANLVIYIYIATKVDNKKYPKHDFHHNNQQRILRVYLLIGDFHTKSHAKMEITYRKLHNSPLCFGIQVENLFGPQLN